MKHLVLTIVCLLVNGISAAPMDRSAWQWEAPFVLTRDGLVRMELSPEILDGSRADLADVRVISPTGEEVSYLRMPPTVVAEQIREVTGFGLSMLEKSTVIDFSTHTTDIVGAVELVTPARELIKAVHVDGRVGVGDWQPVASHQVIFRQMSGAENLKIAVAVGKWDALRVTVDDARTSPVPITGVKLICVAATPKLGVQPVRVVGRKELAGETRLTLDLGARNLQVAELSLNLTDKVFSRVYQLLIEEPKVDGGTKVSTIGEGSIYRMVEGDVARVESLVVPVHRRLASREVVLSIHNGDSAPLAVSDVQVACDPTAILFHGTAGEWRILTGHREAKLPDYDLAALGAVMANAEASRVKVGELRAKVDFRVPPSLHGLEPSGALMREDQWRIRREVKAPPGVVRILLDSLALASSRMDLADVRLVQGGRQIPYLVHPSTTDCDIKPVSVTEIKDAKHPSLSRWKVVLPVANLPVGWLTANSDAPMLNRLVRAFCERKDELGNQWNEELGSVQWIKSGNAGASLHFDFHGRRLPAEFMLEAENGDNPPIQLADVVLHFAAPSLVAKLPQGGDFYLCYGNAEVAAPQYDLKLASAELMAAPHASAVLGNEQKVAGSGVADGRAVDAGSPWLWIALAAVVALLLGIVAKLLPKKS